MDFSNSQFVSLHIGQAKIQNGNLKLIHEVDIDQYEQFLTNITPTLEQNETKNDPLFPYLSHEYHQIQNLIHNLKPQKTKRSLNFIGTAWKWIAGNPDHDDYVTIKRKTNNLLVNSNNQIIINSLHNERINNLTKITNEIEAMIKENKNTNKNILSEIQYKFRIVKEELQNINLAIHWAKLGIVNSLILSKKEINIAIRKLSKENIPFATIEEALNFAEIKVITNSVSILYIVNIPITDYNVYEQILIKPVKRNGIAIEINYKQIIKNKD